MDKIYKSTNRERIMKSLKLELVPTEKTKKAIEEHKAMQINSAFLKKAEQLHEVIDYVVRKIITESLENYSADFDKLYELRAKIKEKGADRKDKAVFDKQYEKILSGISKTILSFKLPGLKNASGIGEAKFLKEGLPDVVRTATDIEADKKTEWLELLNDTHGMSTLLSKFVRTRVTAMTTWAPNRVMENFDIYADNMFIVKEFLQTEYAEKFLQDCPQFESLQYPSYYEFCLTPCGIEGYNKIINGEYNENGLVKNGYNTISNELNMKHRKEKDYTGKFFRKMKNLNQQILMPKKKAFMIEKLESDNDVRMILKETMKMVPKKQLFDIVTHIKNAEVSGIIINGKQLHVLSHIAYRNHNIIPNKMEEEYIQNQKNIMGGLRKKSEIRKIEENINKASVIVANTDYAMLDILNILGDESIFTAYEEMLMQKYKAVSVGIASIMNSDVLTDGNLRAYVKDKKIIKKYLDSLVEFRKAISLIKSGDLNDKRCDVIFYNRLEEECACLAHITRSVNLVRNYMTKKVSDFAKEEQVCFGVPSKFTSKWWNGERFESNTESIVNMNGKYFYITNGYKQKPFDFAYAEEGEEYYEVLNQKTGQDALKHFPAVVFNKKAKEFFESNPDAEEYIHEEFEKPLTVRRSTYQIYKKKLFSVGFVKDGTITKEEQKTYLMEIIDLYKEFTKIYPHYARFSFNFKETSAYEDIGEFMADANVCMVNTSWERIKKKQIDELIENGRIYAFLIKNRTMYKEKLSHTTYAEIFLQIMSKENFESGQIRLNARSQITFRKACVPYHVTHAKGSMLVNKKLSDGSYIRRDLYKEIYAYYNGNIEREALSEEAILLIESDKVSAHIADYDIIKNKRFMEDKYFISISYVQNAKVSARAVNTITEDVREQMKSGYRMLVATRGITDLIYYTVFDEDRNIIQEGGLNKIGDVDFRQKLKQLSDERRAGKADDWEYDLTVKDVKNAYLDAAVGEIIRIAVQNEAVIVIENINDNFKEKMSSIDNQVFSKFEKKLESRLNDYHRKDIENGIPGSIVSPLQMTKINPYGSIFQNGVLFRINAAYTGMMCPDTGFVNLFDLTGIRTIKGKKEFLSKFESIFFDEKTSIFEFHFDYQNFNTKMNLEKTRWTVYAGKPRTEYDSEKKCNVFLDKPALPVYELVLEDGLQKKDLAKEELSSKLAEKLYDLFRATIVNNVVRTCKEVEYAYYSSPVKKDDNRIAQNRVKCYNLARKLWYYFEKIEENQESAGNFNQNWLNFIQN